MPGADSIPSKRFPGEGCYLHPELEAIQGFLVTLGIYRQADRGVRFFYLLERYNKKIILMRQENVLTNALSAKTTDQQFSFKISRHEV